MDFKEFLSEGRFLSKKVSIPKSNNKTDLKKGKVDHDFIDSMDLSKSIVDEIFKEMSKDGIEISEKKKKSLLDKIKKTSVFGKIKKMFESESLSEEDLTEANQGVSPEEAKELSEYIRKVLIEKKPATARKMIKMYLEVKLG